MTLREDFLTVLFRYFDVDSNQLVTERDIVEAFNKNGKIIEANEVKKIVKSNPSSHASGGFNFPSF